MSLFSLKTKIIVIPVSCLVLTAGIIVVYSVYFLRNRALVDAEEQLASVARAQAANIHAELSVAMDASRTLAQVLGKVRDPENPIDLERFEAMDLLQGILQKNKPFSGVFTCWDPNAYDFMDAGYRGERGHDKSGRFAPYWYRTPEGEVALKPLLESPQHSYDGLPGPWYEFSRRTGRGHLGNPVYHHFASGKRLVTMAVEPIIYGNQFYGVTGLDLDLAFLQEKADALSLFNRSARMIVISHDGTITACSGSAELVGRPATDLFVDIDVLMSMIQQGQEVVDQRGTLIRAFSPLKFSDAGKPWGVGVVVPVEKVIESTTSLMWKQIGIFAGIAVIMIFVASVAARAVTQPLSRLMEGIKKLKDGDFSHEVRVETRDEMGELATVFNRMRLDLQRNLDALREYQEILEEKVLQRTSELHQKNELLNVANSELNSAMENLKAAQEELLNTEKLAVVGQMSGIVAHEVLNPIAAVAIRIDHNIKLAKRTLSVVDRLISTVVDLQNPADGGDTGAGREGLAYLAKIGVALHQYHEERLEDLYFLEKQTNRVVKIVDGLRQMSKTSRQIETVFVDRIVNEVLDDMADGLKKRKVVVEKHLGQVSSVKADYMEFYSVVSNLVRNAMQALEKQAAGNEKKIIVTLAQDVQGVIRLQITDNGIGMPSQIMERLFEPGVTSKGREGTGLGLSFSRKVARSYHGDIVLVESVVGRGTTFEVSLPVDQKTAAGNRTDIAGDSKKMSSRMMAK